MMEEGVDWNGIITTPFSSQDELSLYQCLSSNLTLLLCSTTLMQQSARTPAMRTIKNVKYMPLKCKNVSPSLWKSLGQLYIAMTILQEKEKIHSSKNFRCWKRGGFILKRPAAASTASKSHCGPVHVQLSALMVISFPKVACRKIRNGNKTSWLQILHSNHTAIASLFCLCQFYTVVFAMTFMLYSTLPSKWKSIGVTTGLKNEANKLFSNNNYCSERMRALQMPALHWVSRAVTVVTKLLHFPLLFPAWKAKFVHRTLLESTSISTILYQPGENREGEYNSYNNYLYVCISQTYTVG